MKTKKPSKYVYIVHQLDMKDEFDFWAHTSKKRAKEFQQDYMRGSGLSKQEVIISQYKLVKTK